MLKWERKKDLSTGKCEYSYEGFKIWFSEEHRTSGGFINPAHWVLYSPAKYYTYARRSREFRTLKEAKSAAEKLIQQFG